MIRRILLSLLILIAATSAAQAAEQNFSERKANLAEVSGVRVGYGSGTIRIVVDLSKKVEFVESYAENPSRMIIDLKDSWLSPTVKREIELKSLAAKKIRVAQFNETTVRIVIETMAETKPFHLDGGTKGHRLVIDVGNTDFKPNPEANKPKPNADALKQQQERELKAQQERDLKAQQERDLKAQQERELREQQERELKAQQERELREQQEREQDLARREQELKERERQLKEREEQELKKQQERELKEQQEKELKERQERERELARRERELAQRERELKEREEKELKKQQERELKEREKQERELKKQQERELKEKRERDIKEQREREKMLKEKEKQERREKKDKDKKKDKAEDDDKTAEVNEPFKGLENDLGEITALSGKKIVLDPGHGGNDAGAIGPTGVMEKTVTLNVARELRKLLEAEGAQVIMTREGDTTVSAKGAKASDIEELGARCEVANRVGADIFISIHADSFTRPEARGTTGYYYSKSTSGRGQKLADCIRRNLVEQLGTPSRGTQPCNFYVVKHTDMPATLIELGFISNKEEEQLLNSKEGVQKAAQGILDGIEDYFG